MCAGEIEGFTPRPSFIKRIAHSPTGRVCVRLYTQYAEITFHMSRNNKGGRKSLALLVSLVTRCHLSLYIDVRIPFSKKFIKH